MLKDREKVKLAAEMLDTHVPGWHNMINLDTLEMATCTHCVLGQVFGWENEQRIKDIVGETPYAGVSKLENGFNIGYYFLQKLGRNMSHPSQGAFTAANCLWVAEIADRRASEDNYND